MKLEGAKVVVVGMARSGVAAVELLREKGAVVRAVDQKPVAHRGHRQSNQQSEAAFADADLIVLSPGVPADLTELNAARERGVKIIGDLELASWFLKGEIIGITGANGKTTTTALTGHILKASGIAAQVGGNIGTPPASMVNTSRADQFNVLELSSFQLETTESFHAHIGAALNVTPDHLDRHYTLRKLRRGEGPSVRESARERFRGAESRRRDYARLRESDERRGGLVQFDTRRSPGAFLDGSRILLDAQPLMEASEVPLRGTHNLENTMAAAVIASLAGATHAQIRAAVMTFPGVEHRLEFVRERNGVAWYNDSKATNVDAALKAIAAFPGGLWVILGGKDKNSDYTPLAAPLKEKSHAALLIGAAAEKIRAQLGGEVRMIACRTLEAAVQEARASRRPRRYGAARAGLRQLRSV